jgi:hypothetical protein
VNNCRCTSHPVPWLAAGFVDTKIRARSGERRSAPRAKSGIWTLNAWTQTATAHDSSDRRAINAVSISVPFERTRPLSKCSAWDAGKYHDFSCLQEIHQIGAVMRSGEYRPGETTSGPPGYWAGAQPLPHNPRKQRKNPAGAGSGEGFCRGKWRREWDRGRTFSAP